MRSLCRAACQKWCTKKMTVNTVLIINIDLFIIYKMLYILLFGLPDSDLGLLKYVLNKIHC